MHYLVKNNGVLAGLSDTADERVTPPPLDEPYWSPEEKMWRDKTYYPVHPPDMQARIIPGEDDTQTDIWNDFMNLPPISAQDWMRSLVRTPTPRLAPPRVPYRNLPFIYQPRDTSRDWSRYSATPAPKLAPSRAVAAQAAPAQTPAITALLKSIRLSLPSLIRRKA